MVGIESSQSQSNSVHCCYIGLFNREKRSARFHYVTKMGVAVFDVTHYVTDFVVDMIVERGSTMAPFGRAGRT